MFILVVFRVFFSTSELVKWKTNPYKTIEETCTDLNYVPVLSRHHVATLYVLYLNIPFVLYNFMCTRRLNSDVFRLTAGCTVLYGEGALRKGTRLAGASPYKSVRVEQFPGSLVPPRTLIMQLFLRGGIRWGGEGRGGGCWGLRGWWGKWEAVLNPPSLMTQLCLSIVRNLNPSVLLWSLKCRLVRESSRSRSSYRGLIKG